MKKTLLLLMLITSFTVINAQLVSWSPVYITPGDSVTVIFDATEGNAGLAGYTGDVYAHAGLITDSSSSSSNWNHVISDWGQNIPKARLERIGTDLYKFTIAPTIEDFYGWDPQGADQNENIQKLAFVFRSAQPVGGSYKEGKTAEGGDIFIPLYLGVNILTPSESSLFVEQNDVIPIKASTSEDTDTLKLFVNDQFVTQTLEDTLEYEYTVVDVEKGNVKVVAYGGNGPFAADSFYYIVNPDITIAPVPTGLEYGINYTSETSAALVLRAPLKEFIYVIGNFNNWEADPEYYMNLAPDDSTWWLEIDGLEAGEEYAFQYLVDGTLRVADPYAHKILDPWNDVYISPETYPDLKPYPTGKTTDAVAVLQTAQEEYVWQVTDFEKPKVTDLVVYELLLRDFIAEHSYEALIDTLDYLKNLGINAIELMPVMEFEGNLSWGYNPSFHLALDKYYGTPESFKKFVDECHARGIAVILDIVLNHAFGQSPLVRLYNDGGYGSPTNDNPWLNRTARHPFNVGYDFNHESPYTKYWVDRVNSYWLEEYNVDGFRFDLSKGFTQKYTGSDVGAWGQYDQSRVDILKRMSDVIWSVDPEAYVILEHLGENAEEKVLADYGMILWGNMNHDYLEAAMGYSGNISWGSYKARGFQDPNLITYMESHDEERMMFKNLQYGASADDYDIKELDVALQRVKLASAFFYTIPGPKMLWQFGELGYDFSINYPSGTDDDRLTPKPIRWDYYEEKNRNNLYRVISELIKLKIRYGVFETEDYEVTGSGSVKRIELNSDSMDVRVLGNFGTTNNDVYPQFSESGTWYEFFTDDSISVSNTNEALNFAPGEFRIYTNKNIPSPDPDIILALEELAGELPTEYSLGQNYPNPFNPSTKITFSLPESGNVTLKVYNSLGQEVRTLISGDQARGSYNVSWDGQNNFGVQVSSGVYFYRLEAPGFNQTLKMILLR